MQPVLLCSAACLWNLGAIRKLPGKHLVDNHTEREQIRPPSTSLSHKILGSRVLRCTEDIVTTRLRRGLDDSGNTRRPEVDDFHRTSFVDHDIVWSHILMHHLEAVKCAQALGDLLGDSTNSLQLWAWMIKHPLSQRLALDVLRHHIEMAPLTRVRQSL